jgi:peptidoglycan/LPS O-acetylase OafA/YrhL
MQSGVTVSRNARAYLDGLRALAVNLVLFGHTSDIFRLNDPFPGGNIGVSIFFLLSGFLILQSSLNRLRHPGPFFRPYLIDRFARILTAYFPALVLDAIVNAAFDLGKWGQAGTAIGPVAFIGNLFLLQDYPLFQIGHIFHADAFYIRSYNSAEPFWTIPIEFSIYIVFGFVFFKMITGEQLNRAACAVLLAVSAPVVIWNTAAGGGNGLSITWFLGAVAAYIWVRAWRHSFHKVRLGILVILVGGVGLFGRTDKIGMNFQDHGVIILEMLIMMGVLAVLDGIRTMPAALCSTLEFLAAYSYSLYLVHNTVLVVFYTEFLRSLGPWTIPAAWLAAHLLALILYLLFEQHYRRVGGWLKHSTTNRGWAAQHQGRSTL